MEVQFNMAGKWHTPWYEMCFVDSLLRLM